MSICVQGCDVCSIWRLDRNTLFLCGSTVLWTQTSRTLNILEAVRSNNNTRMIHTSTSEVYGSAQFVPITEDHPLQGQSPYSASKIAADQLAYSYYSSFDLPVSIIRPFNTYGPRQSQRAVIPTIIAQLLAGAETIELGSITPTRDFNFVEDTVRGFRMAMLKEKILGQVINLGSGFEVSVGHTARLIAKIMNKNVEINTSQERVRPDASEVQRLLSANERARELLDWSPKYAGLDGFERGLGKTINWFSDPDNFGHSQKLLFNYFLETRSPDVLHSKVQNNLVIEAI